MIVYFDKIKVTQKGMSITMAMQLAKQSIMDIYKEEIKKHTPVRHYRANFCTKCSKRLGTTAYLDVTAAKFLRAFCSKCGEEIKNTTKLETLMLVEMGLYERTPRCK